MQSDRDGGRQQYDEENETDPELGFKVFDRRFWADEEATMENEAEPRATAPSYVENLEQKVKEKDKQLREYIAAYKQEVVENLEQTKRRLERDAEQKIKTLRGEFATPMLEVLDALERSLAAARAGADETTLREGLEMLNKLMLQKLSALGLERIAAAGEPFDPRLHEAVAVVEVTEPQRNNAVITEFSAGFTCDDRVIRPAKVQVGKAK